MPSLYIITGANGAGKSTAGKVYFPSHLQAHIFDGDKLFMEKRQALWNSGIKSHKECRNLAGEFVENYFDEHVEIALGKHADFAYEGHFTNDATWGVPKRFIEAGYRASLFFLGLENEELSNNRVLHRVQKGGHHVDPLTVATNFYGNLEKLNQYFVMFHEVVVMDASTIQHLALAVFEQGKLVESVAYRRLPQWFVRHLPAMAAQILPG